LPTPLVPYAVRKLGAIAGIQITASHNPPADNGYKLYDDSGAQIVPPSDGQIEQAISELGDAITIARAESGWEVLDTELVDRYVSEVSALAGNEKNVRIALTPMHGVGGATAVAALRAAGFTDVHVVTEQFEPNPDFPTVAFPNPEEPGAADLLLALAKEIDADIAIALDPDADRCAVGVNDNGVWRMLRGDETGVILGEHVLHTSAITPKLVATTIVSSSLLGEIARTYGAEYKETLTGFKYLARAGADLIFAYEEALGLCVAPSLVSDKDGISAAVVAASYAAELKVAGTDFLGALAKLSEKYGHYATEQIALRFTDLSLIGKLMTKLRTSPPEEIAGIKVTAEDLLPDADVLRYIGEGLRVVVRPSGTEPKLKAYVQVVGDTAEAAAETLTEVSTAVRKLL
jgi:phosphomannomutase